MNKPTVGIIGNGAFGSLVGTLIHRFAPDVQVRLYSSKKDPDGEVFFSLADAAASDAIVLAVPIHAFEETVIKVLPLMKYDTVLVDIATVKTYTSEILKRLASERLYISTHPMWGPESYAKFHEDITGFRIVLSAHTLPEKKYAALVSFLEKIGFTVIEMDADTHDRLLAETLFVTHLVGQVVDRAGFKRTEIDTPSFGFLMDAVESVRNDTALFKDVFRFNPYCKEVLRRMADAEVEVQRVLEI